MTESECDYAVNKLRDSCTQLMDWFIEGKKLPGYVEGNGVSYLFLLLGEKPKVGMMAMDKNVTFLCTKHLGLLEGITSPHGWAVMRTLIIRGRKHVNKFAHEQLKEKTRNKKRRDFRFLKKEG